MISQAFSTNDIYVFQNSLCKDLQCGNYKVKSWGTFLGYGAESCCYAPVNKYVTHLEDFGGGSREI